MEVHVFALAVFRHLSLSGGFATIDSYYLTAGLEYGVLGFLIYFGMIFVAIYFAGKHCLSPDPLEDEYALLIPASVALVNFVVIKSVFSQQDNHPIIFMLLGMVAALIWRIRNESKMSAIKVSMRRR